jgi:hypothetical protein
MPPVAPMLGRREDRPTTIHRENGGATAPCWCEDCVWTKGRKRARSEEDRSWRAEYEAEEAQAAEEFAAEMRHIFAD